MRPSTEGSGCSQDRTCRASSFRRHRSGKRRGRRRRRRGRLREPQERWGRHRVRRKGRHRGRRKGRRQRPRRGRTCREPMIRHQSGALRGGGWPWRRERRRTGRHLGGKQLLSLTI